jgi:hypothetical protein
MRKLEAERTGAQGKGCNTNLEVYSLSVNNHSICLF